MSRDSGIKRRYGEKEIGRILSLALQLQAREGEIAAQTGEAPQGLSLEELQQVATEVGIVPRHVLAAIRSLEGEAEPTSWSGAPWTWVAEQTLPREVSAVEWEEMVAAIRRGLGQPGWTGTVGNAYEWQAGAGSSSITASPRGGGTRVTVALRNGGILVLSYMAATQAAIITAGAVTEGLLHLPVGAELAIGAGIVGTFWGVTRTIVCTWFRRRRRAVGELMEQFEKLVGTAEHVETTAHAGESPATRGLAVERR